jgi:thiol:disulfide interchange protein
MVNKQAALQSDDLAKIVKEKNILLLRADATNKNEKISQALASYDRVSVPLYVYYDGKSDDYLILPQILTPAILKEYLQ